MQRRNFTVVLASGLTALALSSAAFAEPRTWPNSKQIGPVTITPPSDADANRLIVDAALHPTGQFGVNVNLYASTKRVAAKESITHPAGTYYSFKQAVDLPPVLPPLPGLPE